MRIPNTEHDHDGKDKPPARLPKPPSKLLRVAACLAAGDSTKAMEESLKLTANTIGAYKRQLRFIWGLPNQHMIASAYHRYINQDLYKTDEAARHDLCGKWVVRTIRKIGQKTAAQFKTDQYAICAVDNYGGQLRGTQEESLTWIPELAFDNTFYGKVAGRIFMGEWHGKCPDSFGSFMMRISNNGMIMRGYYGEVRGKSVIFNRMDWARLRSGNKLNFKVDDDFASALHFGDGICLYES